jgi:hypothetical protein
MSLVHKILARSRREIRNLWSFIRASSGNTFASEEDMIRLWNSTCPDYESCLREWIEARHTLLDEQKRAKVELASMEDARRVLDSKILLLGRETPIPAAEEWWKDPLTGERWPGKTHFTRFSVFHPAGDGRTDIRRLWELGRFGWALPLARAYAATRDSVFLEAWREHVADFIEYNPPEFGPHWLNAMEVSLRMVHWCRALDLLMSSTECFTPEDPFFKRFFRSLYDHGRYVWRYLEWTPRGRTNHYLANLVGLFTLSVYLPELKGSREMRRFAILELTREIEVQTDAEGFQYEASTAYHHFVTQMYAFLSAVDETHGLELGSRFHGRVGQMLRVDEKVRGPWNLDPRIGDDDSGEFLHSPDSMDTLRRWFPFSLSAPSNQSFALETAGIYTLISGPLRCFVNCGPNGQEGVGGHGHNDKLSVVIQFKDLPVVVDAGTGCYSADLKLRDEFRNTAAHNTIMIDGREQNPLADWRKLDDVAHAKCLEWDPNGDPVVFKGEHQGFLNQGGAVHRRSIKLNARTCRLEFEDELISTGEHEVVWRLHLNPSISRSEINVSQGRVGFPGLGLILEFQNGQLPGLVSSKIAPVYGTWIQNICLEIKEKTRGNWTLPWVLLWSAD